ncbi:hypothetical protein Bbelb_090470 [Branchiostoma belcheri]|nr:hypothetical protein Bbelb_090470 [Branchiostoma belcheri]
MLLCDVGLVGHDYQGYRLFRYTCTCVLAWQTFPPFCPAEVWRETRRSRLVCLAPQRGFLLDITRYSESRTHVDLCFGGEIGKAWDGAGVYQYSCTVLVYSQQRVYYICAQQAACHCRVHPSLAAPRPLIPLRRHRAKP